MAGASLFFIPVYPSGTVTVLADGVARAFTQPAPTRVLLDVPLTVPAVITVSCATYGIPAKPEAPGTALVAFTGTIGGTISNTLAAQSVASSATDNSGGTSGGNTVAAVTDIATAANAIATLTAKINTLATFASVSRNAHSSTGAKVNEIVTILKAAKLAA